MSFNQFTNLDFNDLRTQIKDYLRANTDFSDFDFEGSNFSILIDVLAYIVILLHIILICKQMSHLLILRH